MMRKSNRKWVFQLGQIGTIKFKELKVSNLDSSINFNKDSISDHKNPTKSRCSSMNSKSPGHDFYATVDKTSKFKSI